MKGPSQPRVQRPDNDARAPSPRGRAATPTDTSTAPPPGAPAARLPSLTGMRFVAAFMVLICHITIVVVPRVQEPWVASAGKYIYPAGPVGVVFFFVLSGFVLTWVARPSDTKRLFWRRRLVKIYPNHLVTLAVVTVLMLVYGNPVTAANTLPTLFLVQSWIPSQEVILNFASSGASWTLACELLFYLCFPALLLLVRRIRAGRLWLWTGVVAVTICLMPFAAWLLPDTPTMVDSLNSSIPWWEEWFVYYFPVVRALEFVLGMLVARIVLSGRWIGLRVLPAVVLALASYLVIVKTLPETFGQSSGIAFFLALVIAAGATADVEGRRTLLKNRAMVFLGEISFALYMVHWFVLGYGPLGMSKPDGWMRQSTLSRALLESAFVIALSLLLAWLLYVSVERPAMRRWSRPAPREDVSPAAPDPVVRA
ncbi:acyltransferase family protein [Streptomyces sp. NPDC091649]|uniref:acyltransferase family protein n=1 Tax=Streptomyces sp. NPDC091649 TaxID=3366004 RepID=UPI003827DA11